MIPFTSKERHVPNISEKVKEARVEKLKILMIAFHYPPFDGSSGIQRTLKFSRYLPPLGWQPMILSANSRAYPQISRDQLKDIPMDIVVERAFALDTARHLSIHGNYFRWMALPDRWASWWLGAVPAGLSLIRRDRPDVIWSTFPIATAHLIALSLHRLTGIPWVADFRDSMTEENYPPDILTRRCYRWVEKKVIRYASRLIFTAEATRQMYLKRYPESSVEKFILIPNGYDEEDFKGLLISEARKGLDDRPIRLLHAGLIYPEERDPRPFFNALAKLKQEGHINAGTLRVDLRASGSEPYYSQILHDLQIEDLVHLLPPLPYREALQDCADADALLLFQGSSCNHQIPVKAYEYLRLHRPILALTPDQGDTAALLRENGGTTIIDLADEKVLYSLLPRFFDAVRKGTHPLADKKKVTCFSRDQQAFELAECLSQLVHIKKEMLLDQ